MIDTTWPHTEAQHSPSECERGNDVTGASKGRRVLTSTLVTEGMGAVER